MPPVGCERRTSEGARGVNKSVMEGAGKMRFTLRSNAVSNCLYLQLYTMPGACRLLVATQVRFQPISS